jgi:hypothetical protein
MRMLKKKKAMTISNPRARKMQVTIPEAVRKFNREQW